MQKARGELCCFCAQGEERRRYILYSERKGGKICDHITKYFPDFLSGSLLSDWICRLCYEALQACVNAHNRYLLSLEKLKNKACKPSSIIDHKRYRPLEESPRSLPTQPSKVRKVQLRGGVVGSKIRKQLFSNLEPSSTETSVNIKIQIDYPSKSITKCVPLEYHQVCKAIVRGSDASSVAAAVIKSTGIYPEIVKQLMSILEKECRYLSGQRSRPSPFHLDTPNNLKNFTFKSTATYLESHCPLLFKFLVTSTKWDPAKNDDRHLCCMIMAGCIILNSRNPSRNTLQSLIAIVLHGGHASKLVYCRLNHLGISISHSTLLRLLDKLGDGHDNLLKKWQQELTDITRTTCEGETDKVELLTTMSTAHHQCLQRQEEVTPLIHDHTYTSTSRHAQCIVPHQPQIRTSPPSLLLLAMKSLGLRGFKIIGDNVDLYIHVRDMRQKHQNRSIHWFHLYAVLNRVPSSHLDNAKPQKELRDVPNSDFFLRNSEYTLILTAITEIVSRILVNNLTIFQGMQNSVRWHLEHKHSTEMAQKSVQVGLGVLYKSEQVGEDMIDICKYIHKYVPGHSFNGLPGCSCPTHLTTVLFGGDQLTVERTRSALDAVCDSHTESERLSGIQPTIEDWHAKQCYFQVVWHLLYTDESAGDKCTLYQLRNLINRRNVPNDPKQDVNASEDFFELATKAHVVAAACHVMKTHNIQEIPAADCFRDLRDKSVEERRQCITNVSKEIVKEFLLPLSPSTELSACTTSTREQDHVYNYAKHVLTLGLVHMCFVDAVREGDGDRVLALWKVFLCLFKLDSRHKYSLEAFVLLAQDMALFTPQMAYELRWCRFVNKRGGIGHNIPCDLRLEHMNKFLKDSIKSVAPTVVQDGSNAVTRIAKSVDSRETILDNFDCQANIPSVYHTHKTRNQINDMVAIVNLLLSHDAFSVNEHGRSFDCKSLNVHQSLFHKLNIPKLHAWINKKKNEFAQRQ